MTSCSGGISSATLGKQCHLNGWTQWKLTFLSHHSLVSWAAFLQAVTQGSLLFHRMVLSLLECFPSDHHGTRGENGDCNEPSIGGMAHLLLTFYGHNAVSSTLTPGKCRLAKYLAGKWNVFGNHLALLLLWKQNNFLLWDRAVCCQQACYSHFPRPNAPQQLRKGLLSGHLRWSKQSHVGQRA